MNVCRSLRKDHDVGTGVFEAVKGRKKEEGEMR